MKLYTGKEQYKIYHGNMLDMLEVIEPNSITSIVTDPPYGLTSITKRFGKENSAPAQQGKDGSFARLSKGFMGKEWDGSGIEYNIETWKKCFEVLKPGGYLLAFGGSRTYHRIACAIEDAGFEIRDCIMWLYGVGFPKSLNIGLAIDKQNGVESEVIGKTRIGKTSLGDNSGWNTSENMKLIKESGEYEIKQASNEWNGWGTSLKPSYESVIIAQKPYSIEIYLLIEILDILNEVVEKCQLNLNANIVEKISKLNQAKQSVGENIVLNNAESKMFTSEDLLEVMVILQSMLMENTNLNTELLCLNFLAEICDQMNKYTTETKINLITELKILKLLVVQDILENTIEGNKTKQLGMKQNALTVEEFLKEEKLKLNYINILSAQENVILQEKESNLHPSLNQIIVARKPFKTSVAENIMQYGVGGINIDECRVINSNQGSIDNTSDILGRFPANTILTYDDTDYDEVCGGFPNTKSTQNKGVKRNIRDENSVFNDKNNGFQNETYNPERVEGFNDSGSASRYFYCAKASKRDRDEGLDEFENQKVNDGREAPIDNAFQRGETPRKNTHPTVKPTLLMEYLVRLVTPKGGTVLDPFMGSGSTGKAVMYENKDRQADYKFIGIELTEEYLPIAEARINYSIKVKETKQSDTAEQITFEEVEE